MLDARENRPGGRSQAAQSISTATSADRILPVRTLENPKAIAAGYAVLLVRSDERVTRQVYLSLHSATKALERAHANGRAAQMVLVELVPATAAPVYVIGGDDR